MIESIYSFGLGLVGATWWTVVAWPVIWALALIKIVVVLVPLMGCVAYLTLWKRKAIGFKQLRLGPNRVGPSGCRSCVWVGIFLFRSPWCGWWLWGPGSRPPGISRSKPELP